MKYLSIICLCFNCLFISAQKYVDAGFTLGLSTHGSDSNSWARHGQGFLENTKLAYGGHITLGISKNVGLKLQYRGTELEGDDMNLEDKSEWGPQLFIRDFAYRSALHEFGALVEYVLFKKEINLSEGAQFTPRVFPFINGGIALAIINDDENLRDWGNPPEFRMNDVLLDQAEGSVGGKQFPFGLGLRLELSPYAYTDLFYNFRLPVSDYLDGISESANPEKNDAYQIFGINVGLRFDILSGDRDGDGIADSKDECPDVPGSKLLFGCPDFDEDGIMDAYDNCPQIAGPAKTFGCPDKDEDGIPDHKDNCPTQKGPIDNGGCPKL